MEVLQKPRALETETQTQATRQTETEGGSGEELFQGVENNEIGAKEEQRENTSLCDTATACQLFSCHGPVIQEVTLKGKNKDAEQRQTEEGKKSSKPWLR